jgi:predicted DCC family thiol-disulfide oxidoreductase YuxK
MIIVFDAQCLLCSGWVQYLLRHDRRGVLRFASIQGDAGKRLLAENGLEVTNLETFLFVKGERTWRQTAAILRVLHELGWRWRAAWALWLIPAPLHDALYRWLARNRYGLFGRSEFCLAPPPDFAGRFLD